MQTQWSCVCPLLGLDLPWRGWSSPSYRGSPGWPALSAHLAERNGAICMDALSQWYNPFTARPLLHSLFSCCSRMTITASQHRTHWLANTSTWYEPHREYMEWKGQCRKPGLSSFPETVMSYEPLCETCGMNLLCLCVTFDHWLSPWHDEWNQWSKQKGLGLLIKEVNFWKHPF